MKEKVIDMAMCLKPTRAFMAVKLHTAGKVEVGQRLHGIWMQDGNFYYPMSQRGGEIVVCIGTPEFFGPIVEG